MKITNKVFNIFIISVSFGAGYIYAQPKILKEIIPGIVFADAKKEVEGLYSSDPASKTFGAMVLEKAKAGTVSTTPSLANVMRDNTLLKFPRREISITANTAAGQEAADASADMDKSEMKELTHALKDKDTTIRSHATHRLGKTEDPRAINPLINALKDESWVVRMDAAIALGKIKALRAVNPLINALKDEHWVVRRDAVIALGKIKGPESVNPLIKTLFEDKADYVRKRAAKALGEIKNIKAVEPLINALKDQSITVQLEAANALKTIMDKDYGRDAVEWQAWWKQNRSKHQKEKNRCHEVTRGDTIYSISKKYNISTEQVRRLNRLADNHIYPKQKLIVVTENRH